MKNKINWLNHFIELVVVFIGITAAFLLNNWRENYKDNLLKQKYLSGFSSDIDHDFNTLEEIIKLNESRLNRAQRFTTLLKSHDLALDSAIVIITDMMTSTPFSPKTSTFESLTNGPGFNIISDYNMKEDLILYYSQFKTLKLKENLYSEYIRDYAIPLIYDNMDLLNLKIQNPAIIKELRFRQRPINCC